MIVSNLFLLFVAADEYAAIVLDTHVHVAFGVDEDLLRAFLVFEPQLVESFAVLRRHGFYSALRLLVRLSVSGHHVGVVNAAYDNRLIGIAFQKIDHYLHGDARNEHGAPLLSGPGLGHANPARTIRVA